MTDDGVFELVRLYEGWPFALRDHLDRLERSAGALRLPFHRRALEREIDALLTGTGGPDGQLRLIVTGSGRHIAGVEPLPPYTEILSVVTVNYRPPTRAVQSLSRAADMQALRSAQGRDADAAVLVKPDGSVLEATGASVFWASPEGRLRTPALEVGALDSIARDHLVELLSVEEGAWPAAELGAAPEAFLASTTLEVQAVSAIDGKALSEAPGPRTREAQLAFASILSRRP
jgi:branched-chain amino acid aminotransferase